MQPRTLPFDDGIKAGLVTYVRRVGVLVLIVLACNAIGFGTILLWPWSAFVYAGAGMVVVCVVAMRYLHNERVVWLARIRDRRAALRVRKMYERVHSPRVRTVGPAVTQAAGAVRVGGQVSSRHEVDPIDIRDSAAASILSSREMHSRELAARLVEEIIENDVDSAVSSMAALRTAAARRTDEEADIEPDLLTLVREAIAARGPVDLTVEEAARLLGGSRDAVPTLIRSRRAMHPGA